MNPTITPEQKARARAHYTAMATELKLTFRCRIARMVGPSVQMVSYVGPLDRIPAGWSIVMRRVVGGAK